MHRGWVTTLWGKYINKVVGKVGHRKKEAVVEEEDYLCPKATAIVMKKKKKTKQPGWSLYNSTTSQSANMISFIVVIAACRIQRCGLLPDSLAKRVIRLQSAHRKHILMPGVMGHSYLNFALNQSPSWISGQEVLCRLGRNSLGILFTKEVGIIFVSNSLLSFFITMINDIFLSIYELFRESCLAFRRSLFPDIKTQ